jgi:molybdopterin molybdotransferase
VADLIDIAEARAAVLAAVRPLATEPVPIVEALGRTLREDVRAEHDLPPFDSSAMDGYAVVAGAPARLRLTGESRAGHPADRPLAAGEAIAISTGAQLPAGRDQAVVPVERIEARDDGFVSVPRTSAGDHVRRAGEDVRAGEEVLAAGALLGPSELAAAAALGRAELTCGLRPRVAVLVTGDELVPPGPALGPGQIRDSNAIALTTQVLAAGGAPVMREVVRDDRDATIAALARALDEADVVCVSGGVSAGEHDHVKPALAALSVEQRFFGVRLKPGKPTWFGARERTLVFGLPGNPVSAMVTFHLFARPALRRLAGGQADDVRASARLDAAVERQPGRDEVLRCRLRTAPDGWHVAPTREQGSHIVTSMIGADALAIVPAGEGSLEIGEQVDIELLPPW